MFCILPSQGGQCKNVGCASANIPSGVASIGDGAFYGCTSLASVTFEGTIPAEAFSRYSPNSFPSDLHGKFYASNRTNGTLGTWVSNETGLYSGSLKIDLDTITIDGYGEDWTSLVGDDSRRPFKDFPKRVPLKGYSEEGKIFIDYGDTAQNGSPYIYAEVGAYPQKFKLLEFSFGGRKEILQYGM
jgi:hypothetical protein